MTYLIILTLVISLGFNIVQYRIIVNLEEAISRLIHTVVKHLFTADLKKDKEREEQLKQVTDWLDKL